jgi:CAAX protease family protein
MIPASDLPVDSPRFRPKVIPLLVVAALGFGLPIAGAFLAYYAIGLFHLAVKPGANLGWLYLQHAGQLIVALIAIAALKYTLLPADYGLHWPRGKTYIWPAILWGSFFGALMTLVDYAPHIIAHTRPDPGFALTPSNMWGWLFFEGVYVGPTEEIPFRALLVTYLATTMPGRVRVGRLEMNWAGIFVALIFALLHATSFDSRAWPQALGQQVYAFALGVLYAYWLEKSRSIVAPIVGHNVSDVVEYLILFAWLGVSPTAPS